MARSDLPVLPLLLAAEGDARRPIPDVAAPIRRAGGGRKGDVGLV
jgi:hypothetical protein